MPDAMPDTNMPSKKEYPAQKFERKKKVSLTPETGKSVIESIIARNDDDMLPWETCTLPSLGLYYENLIPGGIVEVQAMGMAADKILATQRLAQSGKSLDYLFRKCVKLPQNFSPFSLTAGDRVFLLYYLRGITHGNNYEFVVECSNEQCREKNSMTYDLNNLEIQYADESLGAEPWKIVLPRMSEMVGKEVWVAVRLLRGYDLLKLTQEVKKRRHVRPDKKFVEEDMGKLDGMVIDETLSENLVNLIVEVGSADEAPNKDRKVIEKFVERLHSSDHATIREFLTTNSPGVNTRITMQCTHCDSELKMDLPITESFFRPSNKMDGTS